MDDRLTPGVLVKQSFDVFFSNFPAFLAISTLVLSPVLLLNAWQFVLLGRSPPPPVLLPIMTGLAGLLSIVLGPATTAALSYGVFQYIRDKPAPIRDCLNIGMRLLFPVLGVSILAGLAIVAGMMLCVVPGLVASAMLAAAVPAAVIERPGVFASLSRSRSLTEGYRWTIFGSIFLIWMVQVAASMVAAGLGRGSPRLLLILNAAILVAFSGLHATTPALVYYHLRRIKEAIDVQEIAAVFD